MPRAILLCLPLVLTGCMETPKPSPLQRTPSLYTRLGGEPGITEVVDVLVTRAILTDRLPEKTRERLIRRGPGKLKEHLTMALVTATGGPRQGGQDLTGVLRELDLRTSDLDVLTESLDQAMKEAGVPAPEQEELRRLFQQKRAEMVAQPSSVRLGAVQA